MSASKTTQHALSAFGVVSVVMLPLCAHAQSVPAAQQTPAATPRFDTANLLVPNSREVVFDTSGATSWGKQQRGTVGNWDYTIFADGTGVVRQSSDPRSRGIQINCASTRSCVIKHDGEVIQTASNPQAVLPTSQNMTGLDLARYLAQGVLNGSGKAPPATPEATLPPAPQQANLPKVLRENVQQTVPKILKLTLPAPAPKVKKTATRSRQAPVFVATRDSVPAPQARAAKPRYPRDVSRPNRPVTPVARAAFEVCTNPDNIASGACAPRRPVPQDRPHTPAAKPPEAAPDTDEKPSWIKRYRLACSASSSVSLSYDDADGSEGHIGKPRASIGCSAQLTPRLSARVALIGYGIRSHKSSSDADFSYALTYKVSDKIRLSYSNYSARFGGGDKGFVKSLTSGSLRASYKLPAVNLPFEKVAKCSASIGLPDPSDSTLRLSCGIAVTDKLTLRGTAYAYFPNDQQGYDPDFAYSASYKLTDQVRVTYSNYGNNRFFWNAGDGSGKGLLDGSLTLSYQFKF